MLNPAASADQALLLTEEFLVFATIVGSIATLPTFIEFISEIRKRRERIYLSLEDVPVSSLTPRLAGLDSLIAGIADLIDRARNPSTYKDLNIGNEVLIIGPVQSGKKTLAERIAQLAGMERVVTVYNPRDSDALAKAKSIVRGYKTKKVMLLLPRIDLAYKESDPDVLTELDALIETTSERQNVLVIATTVTFETNSDLDNLFGIKLTLPGAEVTHGSNREIREDARQMLAEVAAFYLKESQRQGFRLEGMGEDQFRSRILESAINPAEIEDIVVLCQTTALYRRRIGAVSDLVITSEILETAISRVAAD